MMVAPQHQGWRERLAIPGYQIAEAAKYADLSTQTVASWHRSSSWAALSERREKEALSYLQLIEVAVVSAFRKARVKFADIRATREYMKMSSGANIRLPNTDSNEMERE